MAEYDGDAISRACARAGVISGSALERELRRGIFNIAHGDMNGLDEKFDKWIAEQRSNPYYADNFAEPPTKPQTHGHVNAAIPPDRIVPLSDDDFYAVSSGRKVLNDSGITPASSTTSATTVIERTDIAKLTAHFDELRTGKATAK